MGFAIPDRVIDSKQPQFLVDIVSESLQPSRYVLTNNVGIAGGFGTGAEAKRYYYVRQTG